MSLEMYMTPEESKYWRQNDHVVGYATRLANLWIENAPLNDVKKLYEIYRTLMIHDVGSARDPHPVETQFRPSSLQALDLVTRDVVRDENYYRDWEMPAFLIAFLNAVRDNYVKQIRPQLLQSRRRRVDVESIVRSANRKHLQ